MSKVISNHPGRILFDFFLLPLNLSSRRLALELKIEHQRITELVSGSRALSIDTALRLARYFDTTPEYWLEMQMQFDLEVAHTKWSERIEREVTPLSEINSAWKPPELSEKVREKKEYKNPKLAELQKEVERLEDIEKQVYEILGTEPISFDSLYSNLGHSGGAGKIISALTMLELKDLVKRLPGELYRRVPGLEDA